MVSLSTASLEKLYRNLRDEDPKEAYKHSFHMTQKRDDKCACGHSHGFIVGSDGLTCFDCGKSG